ncbi:hypothetical protein D3C84_1095020 [compost metagenome]
MQAGRLVGSARPHLFRRGTTDAAQQQPGEEVCIAGCQGILARVLWEQDIENLLFGGPSG